MKEVRKVLVGFELGEEESQICYFDRKAAEPVSIPARVGTNSFAFPTALTAMPGGNGWHFGLEARYFASREGGIPVCLPEDGADGSGSGSFLGLIRSGSGMEVDGRYYEPHELLAQFFREALKMLGLPDPLKSIAGIGVAVPSLDGAFALLVRKSLSAAGFRSDICFVMDADESFYYYGYSQRAEVCARKMGLIRFGGNHVSFLSMEENRTRKPFAVTVAEEGEVTLPEEPEERDSAFADAVTEWTGSGGYSGIFITGSGFSPDWAGKSIKALSHGGARVFEGGNLYVKGACWAAYERLERHSFKNRIYLGADRVRAAVGIDIIEGAGQRFFPLISPGENWYEARSVCEVIPEGRSDLFVTVVPADGMAHRSERIVLNGLPARPDRATRLRLSASCPSPDVCHIEAEDLGFGELYPATHEVWTMDVSL